MNLNSVKILTFTFLPAMHSPVGIRQDAAPSGSTGWSAAGRRLAAILAYVASLRRRRREMVELSAFSDRELADIGLNRGDTARIHDPKFAADHAERHNAAIHPVKA